MVVLALPGGTSSTAHLREKEGNYFAIFINRHAQRFLDTHCDECIRLYRTHRNKSEKQPFSDEIGGFSD
jgi:hypothetical protein